MKTLCGIAATAALLISAPAMAQQLSGGGSTNIWSGAQGTSFSYGNANGFGTSSSGAQVNVGGLGGPGTGTGITAITLSNAGASSSGSGYAQTQTSGYAGGSFYGSSGAAARFSARTH